MALTATISLGLSHSEDIIVPQLSFEDDKGRDVAKIACGGNHTVLLLRDGSAFGCGDNSQGQLGAAGKYSDYQSWTRLEQDARDVACGWAFTVIINQDNEVLSRGVGEKGELGIGILKRVDRFTKIMRVNAGSKVFASFQNCSLIEPKSSGGSRVYGWGSNTKCQLTEPKSRVVASPIVAYESDSVVVSHAAMGKDFMVLVDVHGQIVHTSGNLPLDFVVDRWKSCLGLQVLCMWTSVHVISPQDGIHSYGNGRHGQLYNRSEWPDAVDVKQFALGSEHGVVLSKHNTVACWGWGEHGNCGRLTKNGGIINDYSNVVSPLNKLPLPDGLTFTKVFGGCATTWMVAE